MARSVTSNHYVSRKNANLLLDGCAFCARNGLLPNYFITVRWGETKFASNPFSGHQSLMERLRKLAPPGQCIYFWCRECERHDAVEHSHIAIRLLKIGPKALQEMIRQWTGATEVQAIVVKKIYDAESLITLYFPKGLHPDIRVDYGISKQYKLQGAIRGKRVGVSHTVSKGIKAMKEAQASVHGYGVLMGPNTGRR